MKKKKLNINPELRQQLADKLQGLLDNKLITWGKIYEVNFQEEFGLPFGGHTAHKIYKGHYVGTNTLIKGLQHFSIPFDMHLGFIDKRIDDE